VISRPAREPALNRVISLFQHVLNNGFADRLMGSVGGSTVRVRDSCATAPGFMFAEPSQFALATAKRLRPSRDSGLR
jgi:hypothetical protein